MSQLRGSYIFRISISHGKDRMFSVMGPYIFSERTVYFQSLKTVYFADRIFFRHRTVSYIFREKTVYFQF